MHRQHSSMGQGLSSAATTAEATATAAGVVVAAAAGTAEALPAAGGGGTAGWGGTAPRPPLLLEHLNLNVPHAAAGQAFYVDVLGCQLNPKGTRSGAQIQGYAWRRVGTLCPPRHVCVSPPPRRT